MGIGDIAGYVIKTLYLGGDGNLIKLKKAEKPFYFVRKRITQKIFVLSLPFLLN